MSWCVPLPATMLKTDSTRRLWIAVHADSAQPCTTHHYVQVAAATPPFGRRGASVHLLLHTDAVMGEHVQRESRELVWQCAGMGVTHGRQAASQSFIGSAADCLAARRNQPEWESRQFPSLPLAVPRLRR
ncbi:hypothetical protein EJ04DRAFT_130404 [Polyplosphaeria fusca]|uniref:Uncharacterized protein n=1 Tax=Polyplosphaeria fusca TaxID=682080 RepID=A0A9P4R311_9PLEO|nr:hypothetical protein EJ04DRAFT_130404 [Polyplosphaeria fusca]